MTDRLQIASKTDAEGNTTIYAYDDRGNLTSVTEAAGTPEERTTQYAWDPDLNRVTQVTRPSVAAPGDAAVAAINYDAAGNPVAITESGFSTAGVVDRTTTLTYDVLGRVTAVDGPRTDVVDATRFDHYPNDPGYGPDRGRLMRVVDAAGHETRLADYTTWGKPQTITDAHGVVTILEYDVMGRIVSRTTAGLTTEADYDPAGNLVEIRLPGGRTVFYTYTAGNLPETVSDAAGNRILFLYDSEGNRIGEEIYGATGDLAKYTEFEFDAFNRLNRVVYPDGAVEEADYDAVGSLVRTADANGNATLYAYDALKRLTQTTQPGDVETGLVYDAHDNLVRVTDAENRTTAYAYDDFSRRTAADSPDTGLTEYVYDEADNLVSKTDAAGKTVRYDYDALNRIVRIRYADHEVIFTYDQGNYGAGKLTGIEDASGSTAYLYNEQGRIVREEKRIMGAIYTVDYAYDPSGILTGMTYPSGRTVTFTPDAAGRIRKVVAQINGSSRTLAENIAYLPFGPMTGADFGNGIPLAREFDQRYRLSAMDAAGVLDIDYTYDHAGNITAIADGLEPARSQSFAYDDLYRLVQAAGGYGQIGHTYDKTGNRLSKTENGLADLYAYEPGTSRLSDITGATERTFAYDPVGNTTAIDGRTFTYSQNNRLIRAAQDGAVLGEYIYNALGQRTVKTAGGRTTVFLHDLSGNMIVEADASGRVQSEYVWLNGRLLAAVQNDIQVEADVEIKPETLNLASQGRWITAFIELPEDYHAADIDPDSVVLNGVVPAEKSRIGDHDRNGVFDLMVKFDRRHTASLLEPGDAVEITGTGIVEGLRLAGVDAIQVIRRGKGE